MLKSIQINNINFSEKDFSFMSEKRKKIFLKYNNIWKTENNNSVIYLCLSYMSDNIIKWNSLLILIFGRINVIRKIVNNNKPLFIWIFPSNYKKIIPKTNIITVDTINSGMTVTSNSKENGIIYIWRKEEILKVLLHELIHSFKINQNKEPIETYTELYALILNIYLELLERNLPLKYFKKLYNIEKKFGIEQSKKVNKCINKDTNIEYYINEKTRLMYNISNENWNIFLKKKKVKPHVPPKSLRFTITELILKDYPRIYSKDYDIKELDLENIFTFLK